MTLSTIERVFLLQGSELFQQIPAQEMVSVAQLCQEVTFKKGERFIEAGDEGDCLYILASGEVSIEVKGHGQVDNGKAGDVIGEMSIISSKPRAASCVALTDITALRITRTDFRSLMEENSAVTLSILEVIVNRHDDTLQKLRS
ncbi:MAG TPA: cyclic nucleotide-binding domain-containing protein [Anaerolineales bacterium]|nr:cyclic nucleotide-binding domain-containing protein [Anaerolineales bacterium]